MPISSPIRSEVVVVVPCYNAERYLQGALDSVFAQSYRNFSVCAVDDGSTDGTRQVLEHNAKRCLFFSQQNAGPAAARNRAIRLSKSPFVAFLDADDEWLSEKLEKQISLLKRDPSLGMVCSDCTVSEPGSEWRAIFSRHCVPTSGRLFAQLVRECFVFTPTVVVRRRCLEDVGLFNESLAVSEDFNLWLRIATRWKIAFQTDLLATIRRRSGSLSSVISVEERLKNGVASLEHVRTTCRDLPAGDEQALRHALAERRYFYGSYLLGAGAAETSRKQFRRALNFRPTYDRALAKLGISFLPRCVSEAAMGLKRKLQPEPLRGGAAPFVPTDPSSI